METIVAKRMVGWTGFLGVAITSLALATRDRHGEPAATCAEIPPPALSIAQAAPTPIDDVDLARVACAKGNMPLAIEHLSRQLDHSPGDGEALVMLDASVGVMAVDDCRRGEHDAAMALLSQLSARLEVARQVRFQIETAAIPLDDIVRVKADIGEIKSAITASAQEQAGPRINAAMRLADEAHYHWYTFRPNDRDKVREGLRELRWVRERKLALSKDAVGKYFQAIDRLKSLVADSEWEPLLAEAGFVRPEGSMP